ncbi:MAG: hypothetical protein HYZ58_08625 [Acidobacteria bacterium]|nr:hypothetical protein [Acidobacteriota bacterium]MBI3263203.1 hypothetical protein [Acidobacteriota bacterium]
MSRLLVVYLSAYFLAVVWALVALWSSGIFQRVSPLWIVAALLVAFGLGVLLALVSARPSAFVTHRD